MNHTIVSGSRAVVEPVEYNFMSSCQVIHKEMLALCSPKMFIE